MKKQKNAPRPKFINKRKAIRKEKRKLKKIHRQEHYQKKKENKNVQTFEPGKFVKRPADVSNDVEIKKKKKNIQSSRDILSKERQKDINVTEKLKSEMEEQRRKILLQANEEEDKIIKKLEKQLGLNKSKNKNNYFAEDGLDYLLEVCDRSTSEQIVAAERHLANVEDDSDFEEDLALVTGKDLTQEKHKEGKRSNKKSTVSEGGESDEVPIVEMDDESEVDDDDDLNEDLSESENEEGSADHESDISEQNVRKNKNTKSPMKKEKVITEDDLSKVFSDDEVSHLSGDESLEDDHASESIEPEDEHSVTKKDKEKPDMWEDIYGRKRDKEGNVIKEEKGVYIPPHLRNKDSTSDKDLAQLKRQIKSVLNKLAGTNLHWACASLEGLYSAHSRNSVNTALCQQWCEATVAPSATADRLVAEHAALVSVLHANVASEIGAHFLQELTKKFDEMVDTDQPMEDKRLENLTSCLSHLYSFKIYHSALLYDVLGRLMADIREKHIDCVLTALRCVGGILRKDDPLALKNFIHDTQAKIAKLNERAAGGTRIKFLLEVLMAVKNNNLNKIPNYEPTYVEELKKATKAVVRKGNYVAPLNVRLEDLLKADERGKWWIVGSAWEGAGLGRGEKKAPAPPPGADQKLLELARQQRMNTDVRRSIFCVIMSAQDYMDAFERLQQLGLKGAQQREVAAVLLACCLRERLYNPYYAVLALRLCQYDRKHQLAIQFSVWDKIKELDSMSKQSVSNLAQFLTHLIAEKGLPLSVLKVIQFSELNKRSVRLMRQTLLALMLGEELEPFRRVARAAALRPFREALALFVRHFLVRNAARGGCPAAELHALRSRAAEVDKILGMHDSRLML
ncbi:unnamed protein product, partial [Iphiclides podalirius]